MPVIKTRRPWVWYCIALLAAVSFVIFRHNTALYPYYSTDDMDQVTALDMLLIQGGMHPDQVTHPAAGMYLMLSWTEWFGQIVGLVHMRDYAAMYSWANPLLGVAELIQFLRGHLAFLAVGSALLLTFALGKIFRGGSSLVIPAFLILAGSRSLAYETSMFRTDLFSLFYASCSLCIALIAVDTNRTLRSSVLAVVSGVFAGLAFTTKIQILPTIAAVPLFALLMMFRDSTLSAFGRLSPLNNRVIAGVSASLYVALVVLAYFLQMPEHVYHSRTSFSITPLCIVTGAALIFPMLLTEFSKKPESVEYRFGSFANLMGLGVILSIPLLLLTFSDLSLGAHYALAVVKVAFLGSVDPSLLGSPASPWQQFTSNPVLFLLPAAMLSALAGSQPRSSNYGELVVLGVIFLLFILSVLVFSRGMRGGDSTFSEPLSLFLCLVLLHALWNRGVILRMTTVVFWALLAISVAVNSQSTPIINAPLAYYFKETKQLRTSYGRGNQGLFEGHFTRLFVQDDDGRKIPVASRDAIFDQTANFETVASQVAFILPNLRIDRSRIGVVAEGLKPFVREGRRFTSVDDSFRGATFYVPGTTDPVPGAAGLGRLLDLLGVHSFEINALLHTHPEVIRTRSDLSVFVLIPATIRDGFGWSEAPIEIGIGDQNYVAVPIPANAPDSLLAKLATVEDRIIVIKRIHA